MIWSSTVIHIHKRSFEGLGKGFARDTVFACSNDICGLIIPDLDVSLDYFLTSDSNFYRLVVSNLTNIENIYLHSSSSVYLCHKPPPRALTPL